MTPNWPQGELQLAPKECTQQGPTLQSSMRRAAGPQGPDRLPWQPRQQLRTGIFTTVTKQNIHRYSFFIQK